MRAITAYRFWNLISSNSRKGGIVATRGKRPAQQELDRRDFGTCWRIEDDGIFLNATRRDLELLNVDELDSVTLGMGMRALTKPLVAFPCSIGELDNFLLSLGEAGIGADDYAELFRQDGAITYADDLPDDAYISLFNWIRVMAERTGARRGIEPWSNEGIALLTEFGSHVEEQADTLPLHLLNSKVPASKPFDFTLDDYCIRKDEGAKWLVAHAPEFAGSVGRIAAPAVEWARASKERKRELAIEAYKLHGSQSKAAKSLGISRQRFATVLRNGSATVASRFPVSPWKPQKN